MVYKCYGLNSFIYMYMYVHVGLHRAVIYTMSLAIVIHTINFIFDI